MTTDNDALAEANQALASYISSQSELKLAIVKDFDRPISYRPIEWFVDTEGILRIYVTPDE